MTTKIAAILPLYLFRSHDGRLLVISSTDGYCTVVTFSEGELGTPYHKQTLHVQTLGEMQRRERDRIHAKAKQREKRRSNTNRDGMKNR